MTILSIDPSYDHFAFCIYDGKDTVYMDMCSCPLGQGIGFDKTFNACQFMWIQLKAKLDAYGVGTKLQIDEVISEIPPPVGNFSAGLFALDTFILSKLFETYANIKNIWVLSASYLGTVHNGKYQKSDSTKLAKYYINEILNEDITVVIPDNISEKGRRTKGTINNDKSESFLFLLRAFCKFDIKGLANKISMEMSGLGVDAEKLLISRED